MTRFVFAMLAAWTAFAGFSPMAMACEAGARMKSSDGRYSCTCVNRGGQESCQWLPDKN